MKRKKRNGTKFNVMNNVFIFAKARTLEPSLVPNPNITYFNIIFISVINMDIEIDRPGRLNLYGESVSRSSPK